MITLIREAGISNCQQLRSVSNPDSGPGWHGRRTRRIERPSGAHAYVVADHNPSPETEHGVHAWCAVGAMRCGVTSQMASVIQALRTSRKRSFFQP